MRLGNLRTDLKLSNLENYDVYLGLLIVVFLFMFYKMYFSFIHNKMNKTKEELSKIDAKIKDSLSSLSPNVSSEIYEILKNKKKGNTNGEYEQINDLIVKDLSAGNNNLALQKLLLATYYTHLQDNIPDTNQSALESINDYFFKESDGISSVKSQEECKDLTYVSLMVESNGVTTIDKFYKNLEFSKNQSPEIKSMLDNVDKIVKNINESLTSVSSKLDDNSFIFGIYIFLTTIYCALALLLFNIVINVSAKRRKKPALETFTSFINAILMSAMPFLSEYYLKTLYLDQHLFCQNRYSDKIEMADCIMKSAANGRSNDMAYSNEMAGMY